MNKTQIRKFEFIEQDREKLKNYKKKGRDYVS